MKGKFFKLFFIACLVVNGMGALYAQTTSYNKSTRQMILAALRQSQAQVRDFNDDGLVNCIDYSCSFKLAWDRLYPNQKERCELVRNKNAKTGLHHLFAIIHNCIYDDIEVETWAKNPNIYFMDDNWTDGRYDPAYNIYGETERWMRECGLR